MTLARYSLIITSLKRNNANLIGGKLVTPSKQAKQAGLNSLAELSEISHVPVRTLQDWFNNYPQRFNFVCSGAALVKAKNNG